jgi:CRP-like cAMP-binding protein
VAPRTPPDLVAGEATEVLVPRRRRARGLGELRLTHEDLAAQVGGSRENVSRALERLERGGALRCRRGRLEILDLAKGAKRDEGC